MPSGLPAGLMGAIPGRVPTTVPPKSSMPVAVLPKAAGAVPPGAALLAASSKKNKEDEVPVTSEVKVAEKTDDGRTLSLDEMIKKAGEKVNKAGGLQAIGYGAARGRPYFRGRPDDVIAHPYRKNAEAEQPQANPAVEASQPPVPANQAQEAAGAQAQAQEEEPNPNGGGSMGSPSTDPENRYTGGMGSMGQLY